MTQVKILGGLLAISLVGAYLTHHRDPDAAPSTDVRIVSTDLADLTAVTWSEPDKTIRLTKPADERGSYVWIEVTERSKVPANPPAAAKAHGHDHGDDDDHDHDDEAAPGPSPDGDAEGSDEEEEAYDIIETTLRFLGNDAAGDLWKDFAPMMALRELRLGADADLSAYGLAEPDTRLELERRSGAAQLNVGGEAYGTRDRYIQFGERVFLADDKKLRPLQFARTRLIERRLFPVADANIASIALQQGQAQRSLVQANASDRARAFWADANRPEEDDVEAGTWIGKLLRLRVQTYVDQAPDAGPLEPLFTFVVTEQGGATWPVEVFGQDAAGTREYYARPAFNRSMVKLTRALVDDVMADLDAIVSPSQDADAE